MFKKANVVMLPTNEKANIFLRNRVTSKELFSSSPYLPQTGNSINSDVIGQHLYITSDEEIKEGDWCILFDSFGHLFTNDAQQYIPSKGHILNNGLRKVIATTDNELGHGDNVGAWYSLPQPSQAFITKYVEEYNKGCQIIEVLVEYIYEMDDFSEYKPLLKVNSKDNTITIKKIKDSWTREEISNLCRDAIEFGYNSCFNKRGLGDCMINDWINKNL